MSPWESAVKISSLGQSLQKIVNAGRHEGGTHDILSQAATRGLYMGWCVQKDSALAAMAVFLVNAPKCRFIASKFDLSIT